MRLPITGYDKEDKVHSTTSERGVGMFSGVLIFRSKTTPTHPLDTNIPHPVAVHVLGLSEAVSGTTSHARIHIRCYKSRALRLNVQ